MEDLLEYSAASVLMVAGFWMMFASVIVAHRGTRGNPNPLVGIAVAAAGLAICLGAYRIVRSLAREKAFRSALNVVLLFGALSLVIVVATFGYEHVLRASPTDIAARYENARFVYGVGVGGLCIATLWLLNVRIRPDR